MRRIWIPLIIPTLALALVSLWQPQSAQGVAPAASYTLSWWTADGGGDTSVTVGKYTLGGTAGQPDAGTWEGNAYVLGGGFWGGGKAATESHVYLPLIVRNESTQ